MIASGNAQDGSHADGSHPDGSDLEHLNLPTDRQGWVRLHNPHSSRMRAPGHRHEELELNLVERGWVEYVVQGRRCRYPTDTLLWLLPSQRHLLLAKSPDLRLWVAVFRPEWVRRWAQGTPAQRLVDWLSHDSATGPFSRVLSESAALGLRGLLDRLGGNPQDGTLEAGHESAGLAWLLREAWAAFAQARDSPQGTHLHPAVERACRWLCEHAADPLADDLEHLAKRAGCSRPWLSRLFKQQLGMSLTEFRQRQRLRLFIERIGRGNRFSLTEAAYAAGFGCYSQCFRAFRQSMGCSPAEYLRRVRGQTGDEGG